MIRTVAFVIVIAALSLTTVHAQESEGETTRLQKTVLKETGKFDPQRLIGLSLDTVRVFFAMIGRVREEDKGGEVHLHAISQDSTSRGIRPSEADAVVGKNGTRLFTASFYKLSEEQLRKLSGKDFAGGKVTAYNGDLEWPNVSGHVEMNAKKGTFSITCKAK